MRTPLLFAGLALALAALGAAAPARAVQVSAGSAAGLAGQTVDIPIGVSNVTGLGIRSVQFDLTYNGSLVTVTDVLEAGALAGAAGWNDASYDVFVSGSTHRLRVATAGANPLAGSGPMLIVRFLVNPAQLTATASALTLSNLDFNEGSPLDTLASGTLTINATPIITVSPNTATLVRGSTQAFGASGSVTNPVSWSTTNPAVATIASNGVLTGVAPGSVRVVAVDAAARRDTTDGLIEVRGMGLTVGTASAFLGNPVSVPITVTNLTGLGIRSGQVTIAFTAGRLIPTGVRTPPGTLLNGYGPVGAGFENDQVALDFAGASDLTGAGVLCYLDFVAPATPGSTSLTVVEALFNETLPALATGGSVSVSAPPAITVQPNTVTLLAGQTQQFTLQGSPTAPVTWSVVDPSRGTISPTGLFTAVRGGVTEVEAVDAIGATDRSGAVTIFDFRATLGTVTCPPGATVSLPLDSDRPLGSLGIHALESVVTFTPTHVSSAGFGSGGLVAAWQPNVIATAPQPGRLELTAAGAAAFTDAGPTMLSLRFTISPAAPNVDIPITLASLLCNEGEPIPQLVSGLIRVRNTVGADDTGPLAFALAPAEPNPVRGVSRLAFTVPASGSHARLAVYGADGRMVRTLLDGPVAAGRHGATWDGADARGSQVAAGLYFVRLEWNGHSLARKLAVVP